MNIDPLLKLMVEKGASDLFITAGVPPSLKINGKVSQVTRSPLSPEQSREMVLGTMDPPQREKFIEEHECNYAIVRPGMGRFRVSAFFQRNLVGMVLRRIETNIPAIADLGLPPLLGELALIKRGLIFFVGANFIKVWPWLLLADPTRELWLLIALSTPVLAFGVWCGWRLHERLDQHQLYRACYGLLLVAALKLLWDGISGYNR